MTQTFESLAKEFINETWCYFLNNITTINFAYNKPEEADHSPLPNITNINTFINESAVTLLNSLEALSEELSLHGMIDEENRLTWGDTIITIKEPLSWPEQEDDIDDDLSDDTHEDSENDKISYIEDSTDSEETSTIVDNELRQELYDEPIRTALISVFPPASRLAEHDIEHLISQLKVLFENLLKNGL